MSRGLILSVLSLQAAWGLGAHGHQVVNIFHLVEVLASVKQLRKCASDTVTWVLQRGAIAGDLGEGSVPGRPPRVLLSYSQILVFTWTIVLALNSPP